MDITNLKEALVKVTHQLLQERMALQETNNACNKLKTQRETNETTIKSSELAGIKAAQLETIKNLTSMKSDIETSMCCLDTCNVCRRCTIFDIRNSMMILYSLKINKMTSRPI